RSNDETTRACGTRAKVWHDIVGFTTRHSAIRRWPGGRQWSWMCHQYSWEDNPEKGKMAMRHPKPFVKQAVCTLLTLLALMLVAQISFVSAAGHGQPKVDICHFDVDAGSWTKISIGSPAVAAHLAHHDDCVLSPDCTSPQGPGTALTGTV